MKHLTRFLFSAIICVTFAFGGNALGIDDTKFFKAANMEDSGMFGTVGESSEAGEAQALLFYIPRITNLLLWIVAPIVAGMFIYAGIQFVYAGGDEETLNSSKQFFQYGIMGLLFILASFSIMASVYQIIK